ncbi:hypothetical protein PSTT_11805 [Puccinia striiformis]|uniref:Secreted protein n=2 Tax=Puccinia striiformis TaxID=27350 RepID=A0A2S4UYW8_9BASI|nr:hypothetical protein PSTT_11805 [Puccinia striiformis]
MLHYQHPMALQFKPIASVLVAVLLTSGVFATEDVKECERYERANSTTASCNDVPGSVCTGGCTGYVTATKCTTSTKINDQRAPLTTEKCTVTYGKLSATMTMCVTDSQTFTCYGPESGKAKCKGCNDPDVGGNPPAQGNSPGASNGGSGSGNGNGNAGNGSGATGGKPGPDGPAKSENNSKPDNTPKVESSPKPENSPKVDNQPKTDTPSKPDANQTPASSPATVNTPSSADSPATANAAPASNDTPSAATGGNSDSSKKELLTKSYSHWGTNNLSGESHNSSTGTVLGSNGFSLAFAALLSSLFV